MTMMAGLGAAAPTGRAVCPGGGGSNERPGGSGVEVDDEIVELLAELVDVLQELVRFLGDEGGGEGGGGSGTGEGETETTPPETNRPETNRPETNRPETNPPETTPPETNPPETTPPETTPPETTPPETTPPETTQPPVTGVFGTEALNRLFATPSPDTRDEALLADRQLFIDSATAFINALNQAAANDPALVQSVEALLQASGGNQLPVVITTQAGQPSALATAQDANGDAVQVLVVNPNQGGPEGAIQALRDAAN